MAFVNSSLRLSFWTAISFRPKASGCSVSTHKVDSCRFFVGTSSFVSARHACIEAIHNTKFQTTKGRHENGVFSTVVAALILTEENVQLVLDEAKATLSTLFGNTEDNRSVGITGDCEIADIDGPTVVLRFTGRFWHKKTDVLARLSAYLTERIPEIMDIVVENEDQMDDFDDGQSNADDY